MTIPYSLHSSIDDRLAIRHKLQCKPFKWYLDNLYPELKIPQSLAIHTGALQQGTKCIDTMGRPVFHVAQMFQCHGTGGNQVCAMTNYYCSIYFNVDHT